jgi:methionyl-tRNA formyltransferase
MSLRVLIAGQKWFGATVATALRTLPGVELAAAVAPSGDRLAVLAEAWRVPVLGTLRADTVPAGIDLIVAAHAHEFVSERVRLRATYGGVGYHPSLLPLHRGRDAVRWAIRMRERVTGGSVYRLSNRMDGGDVLAQRHVFIRANDTARELWRRELGPLGVALLAEVVGRIACEGHIAGVKQRESLATWEPAIDRPPAFRPDLLLLPAPVADDDTLADLVASAARGCRHG